MLVAARGGRASTQQLTLSDRSPLFSFADPTAT